MTPHDPTQNPRTADTGVPTYSAENRSPGEIDRDLRATRARIDRHLDELSRRSNPLNIARSLLGGSSSSPSTSGSSLGSMMGASGGGSDDDSSGSDDGASFSEVRDAVVEKARRNPIGLAMIAGGLAWSLLVEDDRAVLGRARAGYHDARDRVSEAFASEEEEHEFRRSGVRPARPIRADRMMPSGRSTTGEYAVGGSRSSASSTSGSGGPGAADKLKSGASAAGDKLSAGASAAGDKAHDAADAISDAASSAGRSVSDAASSIGGFLGSAASRLRSGGRRGADRLGEATHTAGDRGGDAFSSIADAARNNPLLAGAVALGVGALLGGLIPETRKEDELFGEKADELRDQAKHKAEAFQEQAVETGSQLADAATERAREAGSHLADAATDAKDDLVAAAADEVEKASKQAGEKLDETVPPPSKTQEAIDKGAHAADEKVKEANKAADRKVDGGSGPG